MQFRPVEQAVSHEEVECANLQCRAPLLRRWTETAEPNPREQQRARNQMASSSRHQRGNTFDGVTNGEICRSPNYIDRYESADEQNAIGRMVTQVDAGRSPRQRGFFLFGYGFDWMSDLRFRFSFSPLNCV